MYPQRSGYKNLFEYLTRREISPALTQGIWLLARRLGHWGIAAARRLLAGSSLTSWYLLEIPLETIRLVERKDRRWGPSTLRFPLLGTADEHRDISLGKESERARLEEELSRLGIRLYDEGNCPLNAL